MRSHFSNIKLDFINIFMWYLNEDNYVTDKKKCRRYFNIIMNVLFVLLFKHKIAIFQNKNNLYKKNT